MKLSFTAAAPRRTVYRTPQPACIPKLASADVGAMYRGARLGGDFFDFVEVDGRRLLVCLLDIAGQREQALHIAAAVQEQLRGYGAKLFSPMDLNEAEALTELLLVLNRTILNSAGGVRCAPAFLASLNLEIGTLCYCNAGHTSALLKGPSGVSELPATGFPLGLFSHATHDAQIRALPAGFALMLVSKGLVEARAGVNEFGLERVRGILNGNGYANAAQLCNAVLDSVEDFENHPERSLLKVTSWATPEKNDVTALAILSRSSA